MIVGGNLIGNIPNGFVAPRFFKLDIIFCPTRADDLIKLFNGLHIHEFIIGNAGKDATSDAVFRYLSV